MKRALLVVACLLAVLLAAMPGEVRAAGEQDKTIYGNWPGELHEGNPFAGDLARARRRLDAAIHRFWDIYGKDPWNYWAVVDAYYAYADAYHQYVWTLRRYWDWEHSHHRFAGRVLTRDVEKLREQPVANAVVTLTRNVLFLKDQPLAAREEQSLASQAGVAHTSILPPSAAWSAQTDDRGRFEFVGIPRGSYRYHVKADGFFAASGVVEVGAARQERDVYLSRLRHFAGSVFTVTRDIIPILRPLLAKAGQREAQVANAEDVEKILSADQRIMPVHRRLIPVDGARVALAPNIGILHHAPGGPAAFTGADGRFRFEDLAGTSYRVSVEKPGFLPFDALVTLERARTTKRIVIFPVVPHDPGKIVPLDAHQSETTGSSLNDPFR